MASAKHLTVLKQGVKAWNAWRLKNFDVRPDLTGANLVGAYLVGANLARVTLTGANLSRANLSGAILHSANLTKARLTGANLSWADLCGATVTQAELWEALCVKTRFNHADLSGCRIYGLSAWDVDLADAKQTDLVITPPGKAQVTVDNLEVAQFIYLLLTNEKIRDVIDTITSKVVLILGRFTPERKTVLDALRDALRARGYSPVVFDFEKPASQTLTETVRTLASLARFVLADITDAKSVLQELMAIVPDFPSLAVQPLLLAVQDEPGMFGFFQKYPWCLPTFRYDTQEHLLACLEAGVVAPAEAKVRELRPEVVKASGERT